MTRAAAMIVVMVAGPGETRCRALRCLNMAPSLSAGDRRADSGLLRVCSSGVGQGFFVGTRRVRLLVWWQFPRDPRRRGGPPAREGGGHRGSPSSSTKIHKECTHDAPARACGPGRTAGRDPRGNYHHTKRRTRKAMSGLDRIAECERARTPGTPGSIRSRSSRQRSAHRPLSYNSTRDC